MSRIPIRLPGPKSKYRAVRTGKYASKKEAKRGAELELLQRLGKIADLTTQKRYLLVPKDEMGPALFYLADFYYWDLEKDEPIVEDVKGFKTPLYKLKRRLVFSRFRIRITEI